MKLTIDRRYVEALLEAFPHLAMLKEQLRLGNKAEVSYRQLSAEEWQYLQQLYTAAGETMHNQAVLLGSLHNAMHADPQRWEAEQLEQLLPALARYLIDDSVRGWLFQADARGRTHAYLITRLDYTPPGEEEAGRIILELKANSKGKIVVEQLIIRSKDISGHSIAEIFAARGYLKETAALVATYDAAAGRYFDWRGRYGEQFSGWGTGIYADDPTANHRSNDWTRKNTVVLSSGGGACRLVNDENIINDRALSLEASGDILGTYLRKAGKSMRYDSKTENAMEANKADIPSGVFTELPVHGYIWNYIIMSGCMSMIWNLINISPLSSKN